MRTLAAGQTLDRYQLLCQMARGGMGEVWVGRLRAAHGIRRLVALKIIRGEHDDDESFRSMFLDEARIGCALEHPNVVSTLDVGEEDGILYSVMDYVEGTSVNRIAKDVHTKGGELPPAIAIRMVIDACAGLHAAHELRDEGGAPLEVVHRDVSPHNLLLTTSTGQVKVIDFGIAKARHRLAKDTTSNLLKGKLRYLAPEQLAKTKQLDRRVDVWGLGVVLYRLLAGRTPFEGDDLEVLRCLLQREPIPPLPSSIAPNVQEVIGRLLQFDPDARIATALEAAQALEKAMRDAGLTATNEDVAGFAKEQNGEGDAARRALISSAEAALDGGVPSVPSIRMRNDTIPHALMRPPTPTLALPIEVELEGAESASGSSASAGSLNAASISEIKPPRTKRRGVVVGAVAIALLGAIAVAGVFVNRSGSTPPSPPAAAAEGPTASVASAQPANTEASVQPPPPPTQRTEATASVSTARNAPPIRPVVSARPHKVDPKPPSSVAAPASASSKRPDVFSVTDDRK